MRRHVALILFLAMVFAAGSVLATLAALDEPPLVYPNPIFILDSPVVVGQSQHVQIYRCNTTDDDLHTISARILVSVDTGERWSLNPGAINMRPGCEVVEADLYMLPMVMTPGTYYVETTAVAQGVIRMHAARHRSNDFEVIAPRGDE